ncbi:MAG TPA: CocE/NonD family hydrolase, partial [Candidatus Nanopelagicaceae bacterium]|nr:CocE/NonD family hydrolase [Candidatus Nanopelagicaceae bacterium]
MKRKFNPKDIKISLKLPTILTPLSSIFIRLAFLVDYVYTPLFKIFEVIGRSKRLQNINFLPETSSIRLKEVLIELEDGGKLATDIYLPKELYKKKETGPTILVRLPYWKDRLSILGYFIASKGYVVVIQDIRGCGRSREYGTNS